MVNAHNHDWVDKQEVSAAPIQWEPPWGREPGYRYFQGIVIDPKGQGMGTIDNDKEAKALIEEITRRTISIVQGAMAELGLEPLIHQLKHLEETNQRLQEISERHN